MESNNAENESFLHFLVDSLRDFSVDDLDAMNSLDFEYYHDEVQESLLGSSGLHIDIGGNEIRYKDGNAISLSNELLHTGPNDHISNPSSKTFQKEEKHKNVNIDQNSRKENLQKKIDNCAKRLRFLSRFTEISRRQFFAIEKYYLNHYSENPSAHFDNVPTPSDERASIILNTKNTSRNNSARKNQPNNEEFSTNDDNNLLHKLQTSMKKTQASRRIITEAIMKEKKRRLGLKKKGETDSDNTDQSIINEIKFHHDRPRKRARDSPDQNSSHIANSA